MRHPVESVGGVELTEESTFKTMREACEFLHVGKTGSKAKCWKRLVTHLHEFESNMASDVSQELFQLDRREPVAVTLTDRPSDARVACHELTHVPAEPWCETCMATNTKEDRALARPRLGEEMGSMPTFNFFYAITKCTDVSSEEVPVLDMPIVTTFVGVDNWTRSCIAVPVVEKSTRSLKQLTQWVTMMFA